MSGLLGDRGRSLLYKGAGAVILLLTILIVFFRGQPDEPNQPIFEWATPNPPASAITNGIDRLAVMENFNQLDTYIADHCYAPVKLQPQQFQSQRQFQLATQFLADMHQYKSSEQLSKFIETTRQVIAAQGDVPQSILEQFIALNGSRPILESNGDQEVLRATFQIANNRLQQLSSHEQIKLLQEMVKEGLLEELERSGVEVTHAQNTKYKAQDILRYWELTSTRYVLCHSGNHINSEYIQNQFPSKYRPVYINAINAVLDPVQRRFEATTMLNIATDSNGTRLKFRESKKGTLALMTYKGALPRAKLYADWISEPDPASAQDIAFSTGFIPQIQVILQTDSVPNPHQPARTVNLKPVNITGMSHSRIEIDIAPTEHNAVLLINNKYDQNWKATISAQKVNIIKANLDACAVYLKASAIERTIVLQK